MIWSLGLSIEHDLFGNDNSVQIQTGADADSNVLFVADPFLIIKDEEWYIFAEVLNSDCQKGEIGYHVSFDSGKTWSFGQVVIREPWHLSFPFIIEQTGNYYMTTCATAGTTAPYSLWLYQATKFPFAWERKVKILDEQTDGRPVDPVLFFHANTWFLFVLDDAIETERLFTSSSLFGPFVEHPASQKYLIRQSGQILKDETGKLWAFHHTGSTVERWEITRLSTHEYSYGEKIQLLGPKDEKWAEAGMHTYNAVKVSSGKWAKVVDGWWNDESRSTYLCIEQRSRRFCQEGVSRSHGTARRDNALELPLDKQLQPDVLNRMRTVQRQFNLGFVFLQLVNTAYLEMVLNWVCHAPDGVLEQTIFFATDITMELALRQYKHRIIPHVFLHEYDSPSLTYGQRDYYYFMAFRLELMEKILESGISIWLVESDSTWFQNPARMIGEFQNMDIITGQDALLEDSYPEAGNIFLNASSMKTLDMVKNLRAEQEASLSKLQDGEVGNRGNEMLMLPAHLKKLHWTFFPRKLFVGGLWYKNETFRSIVTPIVVQNNWIIGNQAKIARAKDWNHWFLRNDLTCKHAVAK